jgi:hypothetical protein
LLFAWNPLVVWHVAGNGHNDSVMAALLALAAYLLARQAPGPAMLAFTASALVKFGTVLLVPAAIFWWWSCRDALPWRSLVPWLLGCTALAAIAYAPYWAGTDTFRTALDEGSYFAVSGPAALKGALERLMRVEEAEAIATWGGRLAFGAAYVVLARTWLVRAAPGEGWHDAVERLLMTASAVLAAYLLLAATYFAPWYLIWPLTVAAMLPWRMRLVLPLGAMTLGAMSILVWATWARSRWAADPLGDWYPMHLLAFVSVAGAGAAAWVWGWWRVREPAGGGISADVHPPILEGEIAGRGVDG